MRAKLVSRREFVSRVSVGIVGMSFAVDAHGRLSGGEDPDPGAVTSDPPVGSELKEPPIAPNASSRPGLVDVSIEMSARGASETCAVSPTIKARKGDVVLVRFRNATCNKAGAGLGRPLGLDVHGLHVSPGKDVTTGLPACNAGVAVPDGGEQVYCYDLWYQRPGTFALYGARSLGAHGWAERCSVGVLDVSDGPAARLAEYESKLLIIHENTINGMVNPFECIRPGQVKRLRVINASSSRIHRLALEGHELHVIGSDGGLLDKPYGVRELLVTPGERVDVLVRATGTSGAYRLQSLAYSRSVHTSAAQNTLLTLEVKGAAAPQPLPDSINPYAERLRDDRALPRRRFVIGHEPIKAFFERMGRTSEHQSLVDSHEIWEIVNCSNVDLAWHQQVNVGQVLSMSGATPITSGYGRLYANVPAFKDTAVIPRRGSVTLRVQIAHFSGTTTYEWRGLDRRNTGAWTIRAGPGTEEEVPT